MEYSCQSEIDLNLQKKVWQLEWVELFLAKVVKSSKEESGKRDRLRDSIRSSERMTYIFNEKPNGLQEQIYEEDSCT